MPGYSYGIPTGMVFKKYYCSRCGNKLIKEKNHRIVSKEDVDYYHYHEIGTFPKYDHSVYSYHFKCPNCNYGDNKIYKLATDVDLKNRTFKVDNVTYKITSNSIYNI